MSQLQLRPPAANLRSRVGQVGPGLLVTAAAVAAAFVLHGLLPLVGVLTWSVLLGVAAANINIVPHAAGPGLQVATRTLLRVGVVLLGFSLSLTSIASLGWQIVLLVVVTLLATLLFTVWLGLRLGLGRPRSLLIATGFAICGASAIAAMEEQAGATEDDVATAVAMVTMFGTVAMVAVPLLQLPLGLSDQQLGIWAGASVHEVGQVVAAAGPAGSAAVATAVVVKLTRVLLLAPVVAGVSILRRRSAGAGDAATGRPPVVPVFVLCFMGTVVVRSLDLLPVAVLDLIAGAQTLALAAALFALGTAVSLPSLLRGSGRALCLGGVSTFVVAGVSLAGVYAMA